MQVVFAAGLFVAGGGAHYYRWLWGVVASIAVGTAAWNWSRGAYSDSGHEIGFSILIISVVFVPAVAGAFAGSLARSVVDRRNRANDPQRRP